MHRSDNATSETKLPQCVPESCIKVNSTQKKLYLVVKRAVYNMPIHSTFEAYQIIFRASVNTANIRSSSQNRSRSNLPTMKSKTFQVALEFLLHTLFTWLCFPKSTRNYLLYSFYKIKTKYLSLSGQNPSGWIDYVQLHFLKT